MQKVHIWKVYDSVIFSNQPGTLVSSDTPPLFFQLGDPVKGWFI